MIEINFLDKTLKAKSNNLLFTFGNGSFFFYSKGSFSKYQGLLFSKDNVLFKTLEQIENKDETKKIIYRGNSFEIVGEGSVEKYYISKVNNSVIYENNSNKEVKLVFDCREAYDMNVWGRYYKIYNEGGIIIIEYNKRKDERNGNSDSEYNIYTAIGGEYSKFSEIGSWSERNYSFDAARNDSATRAVYEIGLIAKKIAISSSISKNEAVANVKQTLININEIKKESEFSFKDIEVKSNEKSEINYAYHLSSLALNSLKVKSKYNAFEGIYAGLPWFFQFWTRDSAMSARAYMIMNERDFVKKLLFYLMSNLAEDGLITNRIPHSDLGSIDSSGLVFLRLKDFMEKFGFSIDEMKEIAIALKKSLEKSYSKYGKDGFIQNKAYETWMDTQTREGVRIEIQTLRLAMYSLLKELAVKLDDKKLTVHTKKRQKELTDSVVNNFYKDGKLFDGLGDSSARPNVFLAYYFYPKLLSNKEWESVFDSALDSLWLPWGGLSTIDKKDSKFTSVHTGSNNLSYHNGDSWFFVNNLAALAMHRVNSEKYKKYIDSIVSASTDEILNKGIFGYHAELSSAQNLESNGCIAQAWSSALYIEMIDEIFK